MREILEKKGKVVFLYLFFCMIVPNLLFAQSNETISHRVEADVMGRRAHAIYIVNNTGNAIRCSFEVNGLVWSSNNQTNLQERYFDRGTAFINARGEYLIFRSPRSVDNSMRVTKQCDII